MHIQEYYYIEIIMSIYSKYNLVSRNYVKGYEYVVIFNLAQSLLIFNFL